MSKAEYQKILKIIDHRGAVLVFPIQNSKEPPSLWGDLFPRTKMTWEWTEDSDGRISRLWILREEVSRSGKVVYSKWFKGRATFFSLDSFADLLSVMGAHQAEETLIGQERELYELLLESSPQSTKELKRNSGLLGRMFESTYQKAMKGLFEKGLVIAWGEVDEGAFPSLACGATKFLFEELWNEAADRDPANSLKSLEARLSPDFQKFLKGLLKKWRPEILSNPNVKDSRP